MAAVLLRQGAPPVRLVLLVGAGGEVDVNAIGRQTVVVSQGLVEGVRSGHLPPQRAASVIAHEVGVMRAGLTRRDPGMMVLLAPWKVWLTFILIMWGIAAAFVPHRLMVASLAINAGVAGHRDTAAEVVEPGRGSRWAASVLGQPRRWSRRSCFDPSDRR